MLKSNSNATFWRFCGPPLVEESPYVRFRMKVPPLHEIALISHLCFELADSPSELAYRPAVGWSFTGLRWVLMLWGMGLWVDPVDVGRDLELLVCHLEDRDMSL